MNFPSLLRLLSSLALRNLWAHKVKSLIVGALLAFGTLLVVTGSAMLDSIELAMQQSVTSSVSGELQVYSAKAKDTLALLGGFNFGPTDIGEIDNFPKVEQSLLKVPGVKAVVPMGLVTPTVFGRNELDTLLERMRNAASAGDTSAIVALGPQVRQIAMELRDQLKNREAISADPTAMADEKEILERVTSDDFWADLASDPGTGVDYLDFKLAPLANAGRILYFRTLGTDLDQFKTSFDRFQVADGQMVPPGQRGFMISKRVYEEFVKNKVARELDAIYKQVHEEGATIASTPGLKEKVARNSRQYQRILFQLSPADAKKVEELLHVQLPGMEGDLAALLQAFLLVDDTNLESRYHFFYDNIAPLVQLYDTPVGSVVTLRGFTRRGYVKSVNVKIYGTFNFRGLEQSNIAGAVNLCDLMTFRDLYGKMTADQQAELKDIQQKVGVKDVSREDAEAALFGGGGDTVITPPPPTTTEATAFDEFASTKVTSAAARQQEYDSKVYTAEQMRDGLALNAAVILSPEVSVEAGRMAVKEASDRDGLGMQVLDWTQSSGVVGQFVVVVRSVLYTSIFIIFLVALVIINNTMVMATLERTFEIGTMRAIGAQRGLVMGLFMLETLLLGLLSGTVGGGASVLLITWLGQVGLKAPSPELVVLFGGPVLYPAIHLSNMLFGLVVITLVSVLSTFYPAWTAARVSPVVAMSGKE